MSDTVSTVGNEHPAIPFTHHRCEFQWYWNDDPYSENGSSSEHWKKYSDIENEIIEEAYTANKSETEIDGNFIISLKFYMQYSKMDKNKKCAIKRVPIDRNTVHLREERFLSPIFLMQQPSTADLAVDPKEFHLERTSRGHDISFTFMVREIKNFSTLADVVEEAARGIIKQSIISNKIIEGEWLALQLRAVKHFGDNIKCNSGNCKIPEEIGQTCVFLYTTESFWYKALNESTRDVTKVNHEKFKMFGPFYYLLTFYLTRTQTRDVTTVYRGVTLTDEQRQQYMKGRICFTSFTSTSINRKKAEEFGNTLFIMNLDVYQEIDTDSDRVPSGRHIALLSYFPDEEEYLLWPGNAFWFEGYEYDVAKKKHIIYLSATWH